MARSRRAAPRQRHETQLAGEGGPHRATEDDTPGPSARGRGHGDEGQAGQAGCPPRPNGPQGGCDRGAVPGGSAGRRMMRPSLSTSCSAPSPASADKTPPVAIGSCNGTMVHPRQRGRREIKASRFEHGECSAAAATLERVKGFETLLRQPAERVECPAGRVLDGPAPKPKPGSLPGRTRRGTRLSRSAAPPALFHSRRCGQALAMMQAP